MILVLSGADFSAKNIGHVDIPTATLVSISMSGLSVVNSSGTTYTLTASFDDNTTRNVSSAANWSVSDTSKATIEGGVLSVNEATTTASTITITATYGGKTATKQVSVKYSYNELTQSVLEHYGKTWTSTQTKAIDTFLTRFSNSTLWNKTTYLLMPILAKATLTDIDTSANNGVNVGDSFYNVKTSSNAIASNGYCSRVEANGLKKYYKYGSNASVKANENINADLISFACVGNFSTSGSLMGYSTTAASFGASTKKSYATTTSGDCVAASHSTTASYFSANGTALTATHNAENYSSGIASGADFLQLRDDGTYMSVIIVMNNYAMTQDECNTLSGWLKDLKDAIWTA